MEVNYKLFRVRELADNDEAFIGALAQAFLEEVPQDAERLKNAVIDKNYEEAYQAAHKMKPTVDLFELGVLSTLIEVQDWGKFKQTEVDISAQINVVLLAIEKATAEMKSDFNL